MKKRYGDFLIKLLFASLALFLIVNYGVVSGFLGKVFIVVKPVLLGVIIYMVMAVPYDLLYGKVFKRIKNDKWKRLLSLVLTFLLFGGALTLLIVLTVPQCVESVREISTMLSGENAWNAIAQKNNILAFLVEGGRKAYDYLSVRLTEYVPEILTYVKGFVTGVYNVFFGVFIAAMLLIGRDSVKRQFKNTVELIMPEEKSCVLFDFMKSTIEKFSKYLGGQVTEAFILGTACYLVMSILKVPYPALIGFVIGVSNLIPILGAYVGGAICAILVFAVSPVKALVFLIAVFILQQIESFTTYPAIVGKYVGLSGFWITVSVLVWGGLFGVWGLFLGVPLTAVIQDVLRAKSLKKRA